MHVMQEQIDACNAIMIFWGTWINHSSHSSWLNHGCKIECLQNAPYWQSLKSECQCKQRHWF